MKISNDDYQEIKKGIENKGIEKVREYKEQLKELHEKGEIEIKDFNTRFICDVYWYFVSQETKIKIADNMSYNMNHIQTATKKALIELKLI